MKSAARKSATPAATPAPSKVSNAVFQIGDTVTVTSGATDNEPVACTIEAIAKGWHVCCPIVGGKKISARAGSMAPCSEDSIDYFQSARDTTPGDEEMDEEMDEDDGEDVPGEDMEDESDLDALDEALSIAQKMAEALRKARGRYAKTRRPSGSASADNGDLIAKELREYEPDEVARLADAVLGVSAGTHALKYGHLNNGQIRMNSGNRIRAYYKNAAERAIQQDDAAPAALIELERLNKLLNLTDDSDE